MANPARDRIPAWCDEPVKVIARSDPTLFGWQSFKIRDSERMHPDVFKYNPCIAQIRTLQLHKTLFPVPKTISYIVKARPRKYYTAASATNTTQLLDIHTALFYSLQVDKLHVNVHDQVM